MKKLILFISILLAPVILFAQNITPVYLSDITIAKYSKFEKPGANKDIYVQLAENITNIFIYYPRHLTFYRYDYRTSGIVSGSHNNSLGNSTENCLQGGLAYGYVNQFKISSRDTNFIFSHVIPGRCFEPADDLVFSTNNGSNWTPVYSNGFLGPLFNGLDIDPATDSIMYGIYKHFSTDSLYRSTNKGQTWQAIYTFTSSLPGYSNCLISVSALNHNVVFVKTSGGLLRSSNFGTSFAAVTLPSADVKSFEYDKIDNVIYITTEGTTPGIFKSADEGLSWIRIFDKQCQSMEIDPLNYNFLYAGSADGLYRSTNKGATWSLYNNAFSPSKNVIGVSKSPAMGDTLMVVTDKGIYKVYGPFQPFTENNYFPLKIGNSWIYRRTSQFPPQTSESRVTIISDSVINNIRYYKTSGKFPGFTGNLVTLDSLTGNIFCYSESPVCLRYPQRLLIDSLGGRLNDTVRRCHNPSVGVIYDTSNYVLPWQTVKNKRMYYSSLVDEEHIYGKNFGLISYITSEGFPIITDLKGCIIDGVAYGDTSAVILYPKYLPLKVGNSWTYKQTTVFFPDPPVISYRKIKITGDSVINGIRYFITSSNLPSYTSNLVTLDTATGNIFCYQENSSCGRYPKRDLIDSLAAGIGDTVYACPSGLSGLGRDTNNTTLFGQTVKTKYFQSPYIAFFGVMHRYAKGFGISQASAGENFSVNDELTGCELDNVVFGDTSTFHNTLSGTVKFNDNNQPASNGYVKAVKLNPSNNSIITLDSAQIGSNGEYSLTHLPVDSCDIVAYPNSENQADFVPTYYPSTINWQSAVKIFTGNNPNNINIGVFRKAAMSGVYSVNGWITLQTNNPIGIKDVVVYIRDGNVFRDYFITQNDGQYNLNSLAPGNFEVTANRLGYYNAQQNVSIANANINNVNFSLIPVVGITNISDIVPDKFSLYQNYPNPFNPVTNIKFDIPKSSFVSLKVYDILGKEIASLVNEARPAGSYLVDFDASALTSGIYFYRIETENFTETKRMVILK